MTKEELIIENARLLDSEATLTLRDKEIRQEFAKAFKWVKPAKNNWDEDELITPSWPEIFIHVGKLLNQRDKLQVSDQIKMMGDHLYKIDQELFELKNPRTTI